jgi:hypothetical protein
VPDLRRSDRRRQRGHRRQQHRHRRLHRDLHARDVLHSRAVDVRQLHAHVELTVGRVHLGRDLALDRPLHRQRRLIDPEAEPAQPLAIEVDADLRAPREIVGHHVREPSGSPRRSAEQPLRVGDRPPRIVGEHLHLDRRVEREQRRPPEPRRRLRLAHGRLHPREQLRLDLGRRELVEPALEPHVDLRQVRPLDRPGRAVAGRHAADPREHLGHPRVAPDRVGHRPRQRRRPRQRAPLRQRQLHEELALLQLRDQRASEPRAACTLQRAQPRRDQQHRDRARRATRSSRGYSRSIHP